MTVIDIRGTHGSGKSWIMHQLLKRYKPCIRILGKNPKQQSIIVGYHLKAIDTAIVGSYENTCGGCDGIKSPDKTVARIRRFAANYRHVLLEGILVAHTFQRYSSLAAELSEYGYVFCFLHPPRNVCVKRVIARRHAAGNDKPLNTYWLDYDYKRIHERIKPKCIDAGHSVVTLDWKNPLPRIIKLLRT